MVKWSKRITTYYAQQMYHHHHMCVSQLAESYSAFSVFPFTVSCHFIFNSFLKMIFSKWCIAVHTQEQQMVLYLFPCCSWGIIQKGLKVCIVNLSMTICVTFKIDVNIYLKMFDKFIFKLWQKIEKSTSTRALLFLWSLFDGFWDLNGSIL